MHKFMIALDEKIFAELDRRAGKRNISVQELLRAVIVPDWIREDERIPALMRPMNRVTKKILPAV